MALIECSECGKKISSAATACVQCGAPVTQSTSAAAPPSFAGDNARRRRRKVSPVRVGALVLVLAAVGGGMAYNGYRQRVADEANAQAAALLLAEQQAEEKRRADLRAAVLENPGRYLEESELKYFDKGIINNYRQLTGFALLNKSPFALRDLRGHVEWLNDNGEPAGSTPFSLKGSIPAGDTKRFSTDSGTMKSGTIESSASKARVTFSHAAIVE